MKKYSVAVVGATGLVGRHMLSMLERRNFPVKELFLFASFRSEGKTVLFKQTNIQVRELTYERVNELRECDIALFSAGSSISKEYASVFAEKGSYVIDNSSAFRLEKDIPLVVPEVNSHILSKEKRIISNPNCSTIQMVVVLAPIHRKFKIKRVVVSTYQSVSGAGQRAVNELKEQITLIFEGKKVKPNVFPHQIAYNCIPQIDIFMKNGYTKEEMKMVLETKKILEDSSVNVTATCVRVPVFVGHSESVNIETEKQINPDEIRDILSKSPGIQIIDNIENLKYPMAIESAGKEQTFVGRIRKDDSIKNGINLWIVSDNLLKGAALNAVEIAEELIKKTII